MTIFEGMCIGFLAGVVMSLISFILGVWIDDRISDIRNSFSNRDRSRSNNNGSNKQKGVEDDK